MSKYQIDETDQKILSFLVKNARMPFLEIARECGVSGAAIHQRVKKIFSLLSDGWLLRKLRTHEQFPKMAFWHSLQGKKESSGRFRQFDTWTSLTIFNFSVTKIENFLIISYIFDRKITILLEFPRCRRICSRFLNMVRKWFLRRDRESPSTIFRCCNLL